MARFVLFVAILSPAFANAQFQNAPTSNEMIRQAAKDAPLRMKFDGRTAEEFTAWQKDFAGKLSQLLGPFAPPAKWETIVEERIELPKYTRERLVLVADGHPRLPVYRLLPRPLPEGPLPGVLAIHGHGGVYRIVGLQAKDGSVVESDNDDFDYGREFAERGYIVAAPCMMPFFPREPNSSKGGNDPCGTAFIRLQLLGKVLIAENLRDCLWSLELLAQDPRVNPDRLGCAGLSYGGRMTMLASALEPRIKVAAVSGACNVMQERILGKYSCGAQVIPGLLEYGDVPEIGSLIAPRPCVWEIGSEDSLIDPNWAQQALDRLGKAYAAAGKSENLIVDRFAGGHIFHGQVAWPLFDQVLRGK